MKVKEVMIWTNGNVMVFNEKGEQVPELQGFILDVATKLAESCDSETEFSYGKWNESLVKCDFKWWFKRKEKAKK